MNENGMSHSEQRFSEWYQRGMEDARKQREQEEWRVLSIKNEIIGALGKVYGSGETQYKRYELMSEPIARAMVKLLETEEPKHLTILVQNDAEYGRYIATMDNIQAIINAIPMLRELAN